jgi:hypothetical protein
MAFVPPLAIGILKNGCVLLTPLRHGKCRALTEWGTGGFFSKKRGAAYQMSQISARSISLDSTFNKLRFDF